MRYANWLTDRAKWLVPAGVLFCAALLVLDLITALLGIAPVAASLEVKTMVWALLIGSAGTYTARWLVLGEAKGRVALAATICVMVSVSALQPAGPEADGTDASPRVAPSAVVVENAQETDAPA